MILYIAVSGEWQIKDVCWKGEPVCMACASATGSIFDAARALKWRLKDTSVWPHEFHEAEGAAAIVVDEQRDAPSDCNGGDSNSAVLSGDPPPLHTLASTLDHEPPETQHLPPLPRASASPILRKKGKCARASTTKCLFKMPQVLSSFTAAGGTSSCASLQVHARQRQPPHPQRASRFRRQSRSRAEQRA